MINLKQIDYDNGMRMFSTQLDANISMYKQLRSDFESDRTFEQALIQDQRDHATATLQIYTNLITSGNLTYNSLDRGTKTELKKLEVESGLGIGFTSNLRMTPGADIQSITQSEDADGYTYANIIRVDANGNITVEKKRLGRFYVAPKAPSGPSAYTVQKDQDAKEAATTAGFWDALRNPGLPIVTTTTQRKYLQQEGTTSITRAQLTDRLTAQYGGDISSKDIERAVQQYY